MMDTTADTSTNTTCDDSMLLAHSQESAAASAYANASGTAKGNSSEPGDDHQGTTVTFLYVTFF
jgi:hypothetical protein